MDFGILAAVSVFWPLVCLRTLLFHQSESLLLLLLLPSAAGVVRCSSVSSVSARFSARKKSFDSYFLLLLVLNRLSLLLLNFIV